MRIVTLPFPSRTSSSAALAPHSSGSPHGPAFGWLAFLAILLLAAPCVSATTNGLSLHYAFNSDEGGIVSDQSGNSHTGTISGAAWFDDPERGGAISFDGNDDYISVADEASFDFQISDDFTVCMWIKATSTIHTRVFLAKMQHMNDIGWEIFDSEGKPVFLLRQGVGNRILRKVGTNINDGAWHLWSFVWAGSRGYNSTNMHIYRDDTELAIAVDDSAGTVGSMLNDLPVSIGADGDGNCNAFAMEDVKIYSRALSTTEIQGLHEAKQGQLVVYYAFDSDESSIVIDGSGHGNTGTVNGATWVADGADGGAMGFDGDDYVLVPVDQNDWRELSYSLWVRFHEPPPTSYDTIISTDSGSYGRGLSADNKTNQLYMWFDNWAEPTDMLPSTGVWHHIALCYTPGDSQMYFDGQEVYSNTTRTNEPPYGDATDILLGLRNNWYDRGFAGEIDEFRLYNRKLTAEAVQQMYSEIASSDLLLHYTFDSDEGDIVLDQSGNNHTGSVLGAAVWTAGGRDGGAISLDGSNDYIRVPRQPDLEPEEVSMAAWVKLAEPATTHQLVMFKKNPRDYCHEGYRMGFTDGTLFQTLASSGGVQDRLKASGTIQTGEWMHVVATFKQPDMYLYVNGIPRGHLLHHYPISHDPSRDVLIGAGDNYLDVLGGFLKGQIDDVMLFGRALSGSEVAALCGNEPPQVALTSPPEGATFAEGDTIDLQATTSDADGTIQKVEFYAGATKLGEDTNAPYAHAWLCEHDGPYSFKAKAIDDLGASTLSDPISISVVSTGAVTDTLVLHYSFDADEGAIVTDQSGNNHTGTVNGLPTWNPEGRLGGALCFDGSNDYVRVPRQPDLEPTEITMAAWIRLAEPATTHQLVMFKKNPRDFCHEGYRMGFTEGTLFQTLASSGGVQHRVNASGTIPTGEWVHVAATFKQPDMRLYVNGEPRGQMAHDYPISHEPTRDVLIGAGDNYLDILDGFLKGDIDEVKLFNRALTPQEVGQVYSEAFSAARLVMWNKLGSEQEVQNSAFGPDLEFYEGSSGNDVEAERSYPAGRFGEGISIDGSYANLDYVHNLVLNSTEGVLDPDQGCAECWVYMEALPVGFSHGMYRFFGGDSGLDEIVGLCAGNNGTTEPHLFAFAAFNGTRQSAYAPMTGIVATEEWIHVAGVWNRTGIDGSADTVRLYLNGQVIAATNASDWGTSPDGQIDICGGNDANIAGKFKMDNLKVWSYAKTDFGDRFHEGLQPSIVLTVAGDPAEYDGPHPYAYGMHELAAGETYTNRVSSPAYASGSLRRVCDGWTGSGDVPGTGLDTSVVWTATQDSGLTWQWTTEYLLDTETTANGSVGPADAWHTNGAQVEITATPDGSYEFSYWSGDVPVGEETQNPLTVTMDQARQVTAHFAQGTYSIVATAVGTGTIAPSGHVAVASGADQTFTITPGPNASIENVSIDGVPMGPITDYMFKNVVANHTISASFSLNAFDIWGKTYYYGPQTGPIVVEAYDAATGTVRAAWVQTDGLGPYTLENLPAGNDYWLRAFMDVNLDGQRHNMEPYGEYGLNPLQNLQGNVYNVSITLGRLSTPQGVAARGALGSVLVSWAANTEPDLTGYHVHRWDPYWSVWDRLNATPITALSYRDTDVTAGITNYYYVSAVGWVGWLNGYVESPSSAIVSAGPGSVRLWMPDYYGPTGSVVRLPINIADAEGVLGTDMQLSISYDPTLLTPVSQLDTNEATVETTALTDGLTVSNNAASATGQLDIQTTAGTGGGTNHVTIRILGCGYESGPNQPVPIRAAYSLDGGTNWTGINDYKDINNGASYAEHVTNVDYATNVVVYVQELGEDREVISNEGGPYVRILRNGDQLDELPGVWDDTDIVHVLKPYVNGSLQLTIPAEDAMVLFELGTETNGPAADYQDVVAYIAFDEGAALAGEGHLFDVRFQVAPGAAPGEKQTNTFVSVTLKDQDGQTLPVDSTDTAVFTVQNTYFLGDINGDGVVNVSGDFTLAMNLAVGQREPTALELAAGDIDGDGKITKRDATLIKRIAMGLPINESGEGGAAAAGAPGPGTGGYVLSITNHEGQAGATVQVPVTLDNTEAVASIQLRVNYNAQILDVLSVSTTTLSAGFGLAYTNQAGALDIILSRETGLGAQSGAILTIQFAVDAGAEPGDYTKLTLAQVEMADQYGAELGWSSGIDVENGSLWVVLDDGTDSDGDGVSDYAEQTYDGSASYAPCDRVTNPGGTDLNPNKIDSDGDGASDGAEIAAGTDPLKSDAFTAYNDLGWFTGQITNRITTFTTTNGTPGAVSAGLLVDYATGLDTPVTLTVTGVHVTYSNQGAQPVAATDAGRVFDGKVDCLGAVTYQTQDLVLSLTGLNPNLRYELVVYSDRDEAAYADRMHHSVLSDADGFRNASSEGTAVGTTSMADDTVTYCSGYNAAAGLVARFTDIDPGTNGQVTLTLDCDVGSDHYTYANALMLRVVAPGLYGDTLKLHQAATWKYRKGTEEASDPATAWRTHGFDDAAWPTGALPIGYGTPGISYGTTLGDMQDSYTTVFLRREFTVHAPELVTQLKLSATYDDGFIAWINGQEVARVNVAGATGSFRAHDTTAAGALNLAQWSATLSGAELPALQAGPNTIALQLFNALATSTDLLMRVELSTGEGTVMAGDTDRDGMSDLWETGWFASLAGKADDDSDGDSVWDINEFIMGTSPDDIAQYFAVAVRHTNGQIQVSFPTVQAQGAAYEGLDRYYALETRPELTDAATWQTVPGYDGILGQGQTVTYSTTNGFGAVFRGKVWLE